MLPSIGSVVMPSWAQSRGNFIIYPVCQCWPNIKWYIDFHWRIKTDARQYIRPSAKKLHSLLFKLSQSSLLQVWWCNQSERWAECRQPAGPLNMSPPLGLLTLQKPASSLSKTSVSAFCNITSPASVYLCLTWALLNLSDVVPDNIKGGLLGLLMDFCLRLQLSITVSFCFAEL